MKSKSEVINFGVGVIFPDLVSQSERILKAFEEQPGRKVYVLHYEERALTAAEAFLIHHRVNLLKLSQVGGGRDTASLEKALKIFCKRMKSYQHEPVGLIAFDNCNFLKPGSIREFVRKEVTEPRGNPFIGDFDCVTGDVANDFRELFSPESWELIEKKAKEYAELPC